MTGSAGDPASYQPSVSTFSSTREHHTVQPRKTGGWIEGCWKMWLYQSVNVWINRDIDYMMRMAGRLITLWCPSLLSIVDLLEEPGMLNFFLLTLPLGQGYLIHETLLPNPLRMKIKINMEKMRRLSSWLPGNKTTLLLYSLLFYKPYDWLFCTLNYTEHAHWQKEVPCYPKAQSVPWW